MGYTIGYDVAADLKIFQWPTGHHLPYSVKKKRVRWFISLFENITQQCQLLWNSNQPSISILHRFKWIKTFAGLGGLGHRVSGHALERPRCASQCRPCPWIAGSQKPNRSRPPSPGLPGTSPAGTPSQRGREKSPPP